MINSWKLYIVTYKLKYTKFDLLKTTLSKFIMLIINFGIVFFATFIKLDFKIVGLDLED